MSSSDCTWYFAIGSMMNPNSLKGRNLSPLESYPGEILDYELRFFAPSGMAVAVEKEGASFHGVLHKMTNEDIDKLDKIEVSYQKRPARVRRYNDEIIDAFVYSNGNPAQSASDGTPSERYLEILRQGCIHYGVHQSHIDFLSNTKSQPRKLPHEFQRAPVPEGLPVWTEDQLIAGNGENGGPLYIAVNGKVREYVGAREGLYFNIANGSHHWGHHLELILSKVLFDPKYGTHDNLSQFSREHCAYIEDMHMRGNGDSFKTIATIEQTYCD